MKKEIEIKKDLLYKIYNLYINNDSYKNDYFNFYEEIQNFILYNSIYNNDYSFKDKTKIILKSIKDSKRDINKYIHNFNNYNVIIPNQYVCAFSLDDYDFLGLTKTKYYNNIIEKLYKTEKQIKKEFTRVFNIKVFQLLSQFNFVDVVKITNEKNEELILEKENFINFYCIMDLKMDDIITIYENEKIFQTYCIYNDKIGLICKCL